MVPRLVLPDPLPEDHFTVGIIVGAMASVLGCIAVAVLLVVRRRRVWTEQNGSHRGDPETLLNGSKLNPIIYGSGDVSVKLELSRVQPEFDTCGPTPPISSFYIGDDDNRNDCPAISPQFEGSTHQKTNIKGLLTVAANFIPSEKSLVVKIQNASNLAVVDEKGCSQIRLTLLPDKKHKLKSQVVFGPNPNFDDEFVFSPYCKEDLEGSSLRCRVYCSQKKPRVARLAGECFLNLDQIFCDVNGPGHMFKLPVIPPLVEVSPFQLRSDKQEQGGFSSTTMDTSGRLNFYEVNAAAIPSAEGSPRKPSTSTPEILVGLMHSRKSGKLVVSVLKGHVLGVQYATNPDSYVVVTLLNGYGDVIGRQKTATKRAHVNPLFDETFVFTVSEEELSEVMLVVSVYCLIGVWRRQVPLGFVNIGSDNCPEGSKSHWSDMVQNEEAKIARWHALIEQ